MKKTPKSRRPKDDYDDSPLTLAELRRMRPAREVVPEIVAAYEAGTLHVRGRPRGSNKTPVSLRLDNDVLAFFKSKGAGWQTRMGDVLKAVVEAAR